MMKKTPRICPRTLVAGRMLAATGCCFALLASAACRPDPADLQPNTKEVSAQTTPAPQTQPERPSEAPSEVQGNVVPDAEIWNASYIDGAKVGYDRTTVGHLTRNGRPLLRIKIRSEITVRRAGQPLTLLIEVESLETPDGKLLEFESQMSQGPIPMQKTTGHVAGEQLQLETTTRGKTLTAAIPWSADYRGFYAIDQSLAGDPMKPDEKRTIHALVPVFNLVAKLELVARDWEPVKLLGGTQKLLRIDTLTTMGANPPLTGRLWADRSGQVLKRHEDAMNVDAVRTSKLVALEESDAAGPDLVTGLSIKVTRRLSRPHDTKQVRYRLHLEGGDPAAVFISSDSQQVQSIDPHTAVVTVYALRPTGTPGNPEAPDDPPGDNDLQANNLIQSDDPRIVAVARTTAADGADPWQVAVALEREAGRRITRSDFSRAFSTATEVLETGVGDCTEHAVLLAALARARGIPARVAIGLVYLDGQFLYHMWNEVHVAGRWIPLDATLGRGGIGAAHLKVTHTNLEGASAYSTLLPVAHVAGRLKIEIDNVQ